LAFRTLHQIPVLWTAILQEPVMAKKKREPADPFADLTWDDLEQ
jgi:hypothetical protein